MKAKVRLPIAKTNNSPLLTIGMIMKNEEKGLRSCLEGLKPLLDAVDSELIITDTGSTDASIEIAREFTDNILHFKWCDDFAAARNTTIDAAKGKWYMYLDADEVFDESIQELINFFNSDEINNYEHARHLRRDYTDAKRKIYKDVPLTRIYKANKNMRFQSSIHEHISVNFSAKTKHIEALSHHVGYVGDLHESKKNRNFEILKKELELSPNDLNIRKYYVTSLTDTKEKIDFLIESVNLTELPISSIQAACLYNELCIIAEPDIVKEYAERFFKIKHPLLFGINMHYLRMNIFYNEKDYDKAIEYFLKYQTAYKDLKKRSSKKQLDQDFITHQNLAYLPFSFDNSSCYNNSLVTAAFSYNKSGDVDNAKKSLDSSDAYRIKNNYDTLFLLAKAMNLAVTIKYYDYLLSAYREIFKNGIDADKKLFVEVFDSLIRENRGSEDEILKPFKDEPVTDSFIALNHLRLNSYNFNNCKSETIEILKSDKAIYESEIYLDVFYAMILSKNNEFEFLTKYKIPIKKAITANSHKYKHFPKLLLEYLMHYNASNTKILHSQNQNYLLGKVVVKNKNDYSPTEFEGLFEHFIAESYRYITTLYRVEVLNDIDITLLPFEFIYVYHLRSAFMHRDNNDILGYIKSLKYAARFAPKDVCIKYYSEKIELDMESRKNNSEEFELLAKAVKESFKAFIESNQRKEAEEILAKYASINPNDFELVEMSEKLLEL